MARNQSMQNSRLSRAVSPSDSFSSAGSTSPPFSIRAEFPRSARAASLAPAFPSISVASSSTRRRSVTPPSPRPLVPSRALSSSWSSRSAANGNVSSLPSTLFVPEPASSSPFNRV